MLASRALWRVSEARLQVRFRGRDIASDCKQLEQQYAITSAVLRCGRTTAFSGLRPDITASSSSNSSNRDLVSFGRKITVRGVKEENIR
jgi:hypothetical protein